MPGELIFPELLQDINVLVGVKLVKIHHHDYKRFIHHMSLKSMHQNLMKIVYFGRALLMNNASLPFITIFFYTYHFRRFIAWSEHDNYVLKLRWECN